MFRPITYVEKTLAVLWAAAAGAALGLPPDTPARWSALPLSARCASGGAAASALAGLLVFTLIAVGARMSAARPLGSTPDFPPPPPPAADPPAEEFDPVAAVLRYLAGPPRQWSSYNRGGGEFELSTTLPGGERLDIKYQWLPLGPYVPLIPIDRTTVLIGHLPPGVKNENNRRWVSVKLTYRQNLAVRRAAIAARRALLAHEAAADKASVAAVARRALAAPPTERDET